MYIAYIVTTILAGLACGYAASLNFVGAESVKVVASMELRQLAYFVTVAHEESFTRSAERLHVAQPGVSQ
jgi:Bacterial regulatory helix-turn-helix protein, lysR family